MGKVGHGDWRRGRGGGGGRRGRGEEGGGGGGEAAPRDSPLHPETVQPETLYHRDDALLYIAYVILLWAAPIPADRWHCSQWP